PAGAVALAVTARLCPHPALPKVWRAPGNHSAPNKARRSAGPARPTGVLPPPCGISATMPHVPLDEFLRDYDVNEVHSIRIASAPDSVMAAVRSLTSREVRLATVLMSLRGLPAAILRPRGRRGRSDRI